MAVWDKYFCVVTKKAGLPQAINGLDRKMTIPIILSKVHPLYLP